MRVKSILDEDFINYKLPSMFISSCYCDFKCCREQNIPNDICQNSSIYSQPNIEISAQEIVERYKKNHITSAVVIGGLEPMLQISELNELIIEFRRSGILDDIVIYTGYYPDEIDVELQQLKKFKNIVVKFGRYILNSTPKYDNVLGVTLASDNQYAIRIS
jgi:organic radical activating enzyme